jgi:hypothetical protein
MIKGSSLNIFIITSYTMDKQLCLSPAVQHQTLVLLKILDYVLIKLLNGYICNSKWKTSAKQEMHWFQQLLSVVFNPIPPPSTLK